MTLGVGALLHLKTQPLGLPPAVPTCSMIARRASWLGFTCAARAWGLYSIQEGEGLRGLERPYTFPPQTTLPLAGLTSILEVHVIAAVGAT